MHTRTYTRAHQALSNCLDEVMVSDPRTLHLSDIVIILIKQVGHS